MCSKTTEGYIIYPLIANCKLNKKSTKQRISREIERERGVEVEEALISKYLSRNVMN